MINTEVRTVDEKSARLQGYDPLTNTYAPNESDMLDRVVADMQRGGIDFVVVRERSGNSVWRKGIIRMRAENL